MNRLEAWVDNAHPGLAVRLRVLKKRRRGDLLLELVDRIVTPCDITLDVGANRGTYTHYLSRAVGKRGQVLSVEPYPPNAADLRRVWPDGGAVVSVIAVAASDVPGTAVLNVPLDGTRAIHALASLRATDVPHQAVSVPARPLDALVTLASGRRLSFLKIDVEGHELEALMGAVGLLRTHAPCVVVEVEERHRRGAICEVSELMRFLGYLGYVVDRGALRDLRSIDLRRHQQEHLQPDGTPGPGYLNDLVFVTPAHRALISDLIL